MLNRRTNDAIVAYRELVLANFDLEELEGEVAKKSQHRDVDFEAYTAKTSEIDKALDDEMQRSAHLSPQVFRQRVRSAVNSAGLDRI